MAKQHRPRLTCDELFALRTALIAEWGRWVDDVKKALTSSDREYYAGRAREAADLYVKMFAVSAIPQNRDRMVRDLANTLQVAIDHSVSAASRCKR